MPTRIGYGKKKSRSKLKTKPGTAAHLKEKRAPARAKARTARKSDIKKTRG